MLRIISASVFAWSSCRPNGRKPHGGSIDRLPFARRWPRKDPGSSPMRSGTQMAFLCLNHISEIFQPNEIEKHRVVCFRIAHCAEHPDPPLAARGGRPIEHLSRTAITASRIGPRASYVFWRAFPHSDECASPKPKHVICPSRPESFICLSVCMSCWSLGPAPLWDATFLQVLARPSI